MSHLERVETEKTVVIAYDGSTNAADAIALGTELCEALDAKPLIVVVAVFPAFMFEDPLITSLAIDEQADPLIDEARRLLGTQDVEYRKLVDSSPARALQAFAEEFRPAALVIGSAHPDHLGRIRIGRTGKRLLNGAPCPIAVAPQGFAEKEVKRFERIAVAVDGHEESDLAIREAALIAGNLRVGLKILSVLEYPPLAYGPVPIPSVGNMQQEQARHTAGLIQAATAKVPDEIMVEGEALVGTPEVVLEEHTEECDLMVVGSRGYGPVKRVLLGSVSAYLMSHSHCPVLIMPRGSEMPAVRSGTAEERAAVSG